MNQLKIIEYQNQRVLTTQQLAEEYGTEAIKIQQNFNNNKERYQEGKHYFLLQGQELKEFRNNLSNLEIFEVAQNINKLYLWTDKGALLHAKSLGTDEAWEKYEFLLDDYFRKTRFLAQLNNLSPEVRALINLELKQKQLEEDLSQTKQLVSRELKDIKQGLVDVDKPLRKQFNDAVRKYSKRANIGFDIAYENVYSIINAQHHVDVKRRVENRKLKGNKDVRPIDIIQELNLLVPAIRIAKTLAEGIAS